MSSPRNRICDAKNLVMQEKSCCFATNDNLKNWIGLHSQIYILSFLRQHRLLIYIALSIELSLRMKMRSLKLKNRCSSTWQLVYMLCAREIRYIITFWKKEHASLGPHNAPHGQKNQQQLYFLQLIYGAGLCSETKRCVEDCVWNSWRWNQSDHLVNWARRSVRGGKNEQMLSHSLTLACGIIFSCLFERSYKRDSLIIRYPLYWINSIRGSFFLWLCVFDALSLHPHTQ